MSFNKMILIGNLGRDPELRYTPQGDPVCNFSVAVNERRRDKSGEFQDEVTWFRVTLWRNMAENASKYLTKGSPVYIEGRLKVDDWQDREGKDRYTLNVTATDMHFIGSARSDDYSSGSEGSSDNSVSEDSSDAGNESKGLDDEEIPF